MTFDLLGLLTSKIHPLKLHKIAYCRASSWLKCAGSTAHSTKRVVKETTCQASPRMGAKSVLYDFSGCKSQFGFGKAPAKRSHLHCTQTHTHTQPSYCHCVLKRVLHRSIGIHWHWNPMAKLQVPLSFLEHVLLGTLASHMKLQCVWARWRSEARLVQLLRQRLQLSTDEACGVEVPKQG